MDYLRDIKKMNQVYSNDLNEILLKTPPNIFRYALLVFITCIVVITVIGYGFEYTEKEDFNFVYQKQEDSGQIVFFSNNDISDFLDSAIIEILDSNEQKVMSLKVGDFKKVTYWKIDGNIISEKVLNDKSFTNISEVSRSYKFILFVENSSIFQKLNLIKVGKIKVPLNEKKFYQLIL